MTTRRILRENRRLVFRRIRALLAAALVLGVGAALTVAAWTDQENAKATITAGSFSIVSKTQESDDFESHDGEQYAAALNLSASALYPGQSAAAWIQIRTGDDSVGGAVRLAGVSSSAPDARDIAFRGALTTRLSIVDAAEDCNDGTTGGTAVPWNDPALNIGGASLEGDGGDIVIYCFVLTLDDTAPNNAQGGSVSATWTFTGTTDTTP